MIRFWRFMSAVCRKSQTWFFRIRKGAAKVKVAASVFSVPATHRLRMAGGVAAIFLLLAASLPVVAADAPHIEARSTSCSACHGTAVADSPFWNPATDDRFDNLCLLNCHNASAPPYTDTGAPLARTHSSATTSTRYGAWRTRCIDCHNPHVQEQKLWKNSDPDQLFLATGEISGYTYDAATDTSTLSYATITYKSGWDASSLSAKTESGRGAILLPNLGKVGFSFPILAVDASGGTIQVKGDVRPVYTYVSPPTNFGVIYGQFVRRYVRVSGSPVAVKFFGRTGPNSFADNDTTRDGICQVCHTQTSHWSPTAEDGGDSHHAEENCMECHPHANGFAHGGDGTGPVCMACHNSGAHSAHLSMNKTCSSCHDVANMRDAGGTVIDPRTTGACSSCHNDGRGGPPNHTDYAANWDNPAYDLACDGCHSGRPFLDALVMATDGHDRLVGEAGIRQYPCAYCHNDTVDSAWNLTDRHCNGTVDVRSPPPSGRCKTKTLQPNPATTPQQRPVAIFTAIRTAPRWIRKCDPTRGTEGPRPATPVMVMIRPSTTVAPATATTGHGARNKNGSPPCRCTPTPARGQPAPTPTTATCSPVTPATTAMPTPWPAAAVSTVMPTLTAILWSPAARCQTPNT